MSTASKTVFSIFLKRHPPRIRINGLRTINADFKGNNRSIVDHIFNVRKAMQKKWEYISDKLQFFIVCKLAYDNVYKKACINKSRKYMKVESVLSGPLYITKTRGTNSTTKNYSFSRLAVGRNITSRLATRRISTSFSYRKYPLFKDCLN